jgi:hypothetical protein
MKIPTNAIIPDGKITRYLLLPRQQDDKSKYLSLAGFTLKNPEQLKQAIYQLIKTKEAQEDSTNEYGTFYSSTQESPRQESPREMLATSRFHVFRMS